MQKELKVSASLQAEGNFHMGTYLLQQLERQITKCAQSCDANSTQ